MRRSALVAVALTVLVSLAATTVRASVLDQATGNPVTWLEDNDFEAILGGNNNNMLDPGELLFAIAEFPDFYDPVASLTSPIAQFSTATRMLTAVQMVKVQSIAISGGGTIATATFVAPTPAEWAAAGIAGVSTGTLVIFYDDPIPAVGGHLTANGTVAAGVTSATEGTKLLEFGFTGAGGTPGLNEFYSGVAFDAGGMPTDVTQIDVLSFKAALNITSGGGLAAHNYLGAIALIPDSQFTGPTHLQITGRNIVGGGTVSFPLATDTEAYISTLQIPEPGTVFVWGLLALSVGGGKAFMNRRRASKIAA